MNKQQLMSLRQQAHKLKPVVIIGTNELTDAVHDEIDCALTAHELIKVRVNARDKQHRELMTQQICDRHHAELVQVIGHIVAIYRKSEEG